jgi:hypothetical protein
MIWFKYIEKLKYIILWILLSYHAKIYATDAWILWWVTKEKLRDWDIHVDDIPNILRYAIDYLMWFAWTIAIIFIIIWAYKVALWTLEWDKSKWKETIMYALLWFVLAALSWLIMKLIIDNFS